MLNFVKLLDFNKNLERGSIIRCKGKFPYESYVDFMVVENYGNKSRSYALLVISGYKAGLTYVVLPQESIPTDNEGYAINLEWLRCNWSKWGYIDCPLDDVYIVFRKPPENIYDL